MDDLDATQWMDILKARTKDNAREAVDRAGELILELDPEQVLEKAWKYLDTEFQSSQRPSQQLLSRLLTGPMISLGDPHKLSAFAQDCESALSLMKSTGALSSLNETTNQSTIINRLAPELQGKWYDYKLDRLHSTGAVQFEKFAQWIDNQATIRLDMAAMAIKTPADSRATTDATVARQSQSQTQSSWRSDEQRAKGPCAFCKLKKRF